MRTIPFLVSGTGPDGNRNYLVTYDGGYQEVIWLKMEYGHWGGDFEMCVLAHMLDTLIYSYQADTNYWLGCFPHAIDRRVPQNVNVHSLYIFLRRNHFQVVTAVRKRLTS